MDVNIFLTLLVAFSSVTSLLTDFVKKALDNRNIKYSSNVVVLIVAFVVGICGMLGYDIMMNIPLTINAFVGAIFMGIASAVGAMVGYDKVAQTIEQFHQGGDMNA